MPFGFFAAAREKRALLKLPPQFAGVDLIAGRAEAESRARAGKAVLVGAPRHLKWLTFVCPCGCGEVLDLNLMRSQSPSWRVTRHRDGTITVIPSVWTTSCRSHFWVARGRIRWV